VVPSALITALAAAADTEVDRALRHGAGAFKQKQPTGEVGFVAAFVLGAVPEIAQVWRPILRPAGLSVKMTGVFVHQSPYVDFDDYAGVPRTCELADLLVVADDLTASGSGRRMATLVQAKIADPGGGVALSDQGDLNQLDLLSRWPPFKLPKRFPPGDRDFSTCTHPGSKQDCGRYGLIDKQPNPDWFQQAPANPLPAGGARLGTFIAHMLEDGQVGYGREATGLSDDWSRTVDELMRTTGGTAFSYVAGFQKQRPLRGHFAMAFVIDTALQRGHGIWFDAQPPSGGRPEQLDGRDAEGINLVHIAVVDEEKRRS
jgi:hypothetical protein